MKTTAVTLTLILIAAPIALATTDLGLSQDLSGRTSFRLDTNTFLFQIPIKNQIDQLGIGAKLPTPISDLYGVGKLYIGGRRKFELQSLDLGLGYPIQWNNTTLRGELTVTNPQWSKAKQWEFHPSISLQFNFENVFTESKGG